MNTARVEELIFQKSITPFRCRRFQCDEEVEMAFRERLPIHEPDFYRDGNSALFAKMGQMFICDINNISVEFRLRPLDVAGSTVMKKWKWLFVSG